MKPKAVIATITLAAVPFFAAAAVQHGNRQIPETTVQQGASMMPGYAFGHGMMGLIDQVKGDLASLAHEDDPATLHQKIAQDQSLLAGFEGRMGWGQGMRGAMMSGGMMSGYGYNCYGAPQQPQK